LGLDTTTDKIFPTEIVLPEDIIFVSCGSYNSIFLGESRKLYICGAGYNSELDSALIGNKNAKQITTPVVIETKTE